MEEEWRQDRSHLRNNRQELGSSSSNEVGGWGGGGLNDMIFHEERILIVSSPCLGVWSNHLFFLAVEKESSRRIFSETERLRVNQCKRLILCASFSADPPASHHNTWWCSGTTTRTRTRTRIEIQATADQADN